MKSRPFTYNNGNQISGTEKFGNLTVGIPTNGYQSTNLQWWNGPDEDLGYVVAKLNVDENGNGLQPTPIEGVFGNVGFNRTKTWLYSEFLDLVNSEFGQNFTNPVDAKVWLESNSKWTSFIDNLQNSFRNRVLTVGGEFESFSCLESQINDLINKDLLDSASFVLTPNGYKENVLFSVTPSPVGTNLLLQSEGFTLSPWGLLAEPLITRTANAGTSPIGTNNATLLTSNTDLSGRGIRQGVTLSQGVQYVFSIWARSDNGARIYLDISDNGVTSFNLTTEWQRIQVTGQYWVPYGPGTQFVDITFDANQLGKTCLIWGAQLEIGTNAGNYIPTTTRQAINETICDLTVTRATTGTRVNSDGLIEEVPYNLFSQSETFDNAYWTKQNTTISINTITAPNGTMTADKVICNSGVTYSYTGPSGVNIVSNSFPLNPTERVVSFYLKYGGLNRIRVMYGSSTNLSSGIYVEVDLQLGTITGSNGGSVASNFFIEDAGDGWYRVGFTNIMTLVTTNNRFAIGLGDTTKTVGDGVDGVFVWGAQLVNGTQPKDYFPVTNRFNIPRLDYVDGCPSLLVEQQRTNLFLQSADFTNGWAQEGSSITGNTQISPDGLLTADTIAELATNDIHRTYRTTAIAVTANAIYTASFFVKKNNIRYVRLILTQQSTTTIWAGAQFDLDTQTFTSQVGTEGGVFTNATIVAFPNGWYRISVSGSIPGTGMIPMLVLSNGSALLNTDTRGCPIYLGNTSNSLFIWGAQLEAGSNATSYIPTTTGSVTRNADVISNTNASNLIGQTEGTIFLEFIPKVLNSDIARIVSSNNWSNGFFIFINSVGSLQCIIRASDSYVVNSIIAVNISNTPVYKVVLKYSSGNIKIFVNGFLRSTHTATYTFSSLLNGVFLDNAQWTSSNQTRGINTLALWKTQITDAQAIQLTTL